LKLDNNNASNESDEESKSESEQWDNEEKDVDVAEDSKVYTSNFEL
jgi:hypothetical protein